MPAPNTIASRTPAVTCRKARARSGPSSGSEMASTVDIGRAVAFEAGGARRIRPPHLQRQKWDDSRPPAPRPRRRQPQCTGRAEGALVPSDTVTADDATSADAEILRQAEQAHDVPGMVGAEKRPDAVRPEITLHTYVEEQRRRWVHQCAGSA
jgi:hypothetical protein